MMIGALFSLCALLLVVSHGDLKPCSLYSPRQMGYIEKGDLMIGGLFPLTVSKMNAVYSFREKRSPTACEPYGSDFYTWMQAMRFAIDEINKNDALLPNISLGFHIFDTCLDTYRSLWGTLWMLSGEENPIINFQCSPSTPLAVIGDSTSATSIPLATLLGVYRYPQVSYSASAASLGNRILYPSFFRTMPSDEHQSRALAHLVSHMGWNWVGLLSLDDDFGILGSQILKEELQKLGVCLAYHETFGKRTPLKKLRSIVDLVLGSSARVVIIFSVDTSVKMLLDLLIENGDARRIWISCNAWSSSSRLSVPKYSLTMKGTLGISMHEAIMPGFKEFLLSIRPATALPSDIFVERFWEMVHGCTWTGVRNGSVLCTGEEKLNGIKGVVSEFEESDFRSQYLIYNAVYAVAYALHRLFFCAPEKYCEDPRTVKPWQVLRALSDVHYETVMGEEMYFDRKGDPPTVYDIVNWHRRSDGSVSFVKVGNYTKTETNGAELHINISAVQWITEEHQIPRSMCSESCTPGFRNAAQKGQPVCCFDCIPCSEGEISTQTDSSKCFACSPDTWPNENKTTCISKLVEFLSFLEPLGITLTLTAIFFSSISMSILCTFYKNKDTAIVKANNRNITYLLLTSLSINFLCPLLFIGEPHKFTCLFRQGAFGVIFVLSVSSVLAKTITVVIAFRATKPGNNMRRFLGPQVPALTISICVFIQLLICIYWILTCPPFPERNIRIKTGIIVFQCNECSDTLLWCMLGYMAFLACSSFLVAFLARKLPDNFNEAKWITFSMLIFLSVWISFVPAYLSTQGKYMVSVEIFGILSSSAGILVCIFLPKSYIILFRPELNTRGHLLGKVLTQKTNKSLL